MKYEEEFTQWLYTKYPINNGDALIHYLEQGDIAVIVIRVTKGEK